MGSEITWTPLEDCLDALIDYRGKTPEKTASGIPLITAKIVKGGTIEAPTEFIAEEDYEAWMRRGLPKVGDVLLTTEAPLGEVAQLKSERVALAQRIILLRGQKGLLHNGYLKYFFLSEDGHRSLEARASGTTVLGIKQSELRRIEIPVIPYSAQTEIAETLGALDNKIALLRETNATLEAIAQAIFKSWFVDFDPVRAKAEGRDPEGVPPEVAELFPSELSESELGAIPKGWRTGTLADFTDLNPESWTNKIHPNTLLYVDLANTKDNRIEAVTEFQFEDAPSRARRVLRSGDTIVGTVRPGNRSFAFVQDPPIALTGSTGFAVLRPRQQSNAEFVFIAATKPESIDRLAHLADGGAYPAVRPEIVQSLPIVVAPQSVLDSFHQTALPLYRRVAANVAEIESLGAIRDTLLPRLMSGKVRVAEFVSSYPPE